MTVEGSKKVIRYVEGIGLVKMEVLVPEEEVKRRQAEAEQKIEELYEKFYERLGDIWAVDIYFKEGDMEFMIHDADGGIELQIENYKDDTTFYVTLDTNKKCGYIWRRTIDKGDELKKIDIDKFEEFLDAFLTINDIADKVVMSKKELFDLISSFRYELLEKRREDPFEALEIALRKVFGGEGA